MARVVLVAAAGSALAATLFFAEVGSATGYPQGQVKFGDFVFKVDIADTPARQMLGLGGRRALAPAEGMLFVYNEAGKHTFWMRGMVIPIDIIWLYNHKVVHIEHRVPPPGAGTRDRDLPVYRPQQPANFVLEIAAGRAKELGMRPGSRVSYQLPQP